MFKALFNITYTAAEPPRNYTGNNRAAYIAERKFYTLTAKYNFFSYILNNKKVCRNATAEDYFTRGGTNTGLFNMDGAIDESKKKELKKALKNTKSIIWHGFISFDEETSRGFCDLTSACKFMRRTFGAFLEEAGFRKDNIELYCALHEDTDNRHIHFAFFEKEPKRLDKNGVVGYTRRGKIPRRALDNYLVSANMHLSEHADEYYTARDRAFYELRQIREARARTGRFVSTNRTDEMLLIQDFNRLIAKLPKEGRLQYNSANMAELRPEIDALALKLIKSNPQALEAHMDVLRQLARVERETSDIAREGKLGYINGRRISAEEMSRLMGGETRNALMPVEYVDPQGTDYFRRLKADYDARLGNVVLNMCKDMLRVRGTSVVRKAYVNDARRKCEAKYKRRRRGDLMILMQRALNEVCEAESANFIKSVKQIEAEMRYGQAE